MNPIYYILFILPVIWSRRLTSKPSSKKYKYNLPLFWKIGKKYEFQDKPPRKIIFNGFPIAIYKDNKNKLIAVSDICVHRGASLSCGKVLSNNCLQCPYHGWEYNKGLVHSIPGLPEVNKSTFGVPQFEIQEINQDIYLRPTYDLNSQKGSFLNHSVYIPPEENDSSFIKISGSIHIKRPYNMITENVLDMMHISYVHSFGNSLSPVPFDIHFEDLNEIAGRTTFHYTSAPTSMSKLIGGAKFVIVENEFHLPDVTVTRVNANKITKTIITHCYPINKNESIFHFDLYRNFFTSDWFNPLFELQMYITLKEDLKILNNIYDKYQLGFISNKFDITQVKYRSKIRKIMNNI
jgi:phenylpropionate dioxygenase-like ring-hydroxylating dioxygenase large terminal subunit